MTQATGKDRKTAWLMMDDDYVQSRTTANLHAHKTEKRSIAQMVMNRINCNAGTHRAEQAICKVGNRTVRPKVY